MPGDDLRHPDGWKPGTRRRRERGAKRSLRTRAVEWFETVHCVYMALYSVAFVVILVLAFLGVLPD